MSAPLPLPLPTRIVILCPPHHHHHFRRRWGNNIVVHLTDGQTTWRQQLHPTPLGALVHVNTLLDEGYPVAFQTALRELLDHAAQSAPEFVAPLVAQESRA